MGYSICESSGVEKCLTFFRNFKEDAMAEKVVYKEK